MHYLIYCFNIICIIISVVIHHCQGRNTQLTDLLESVTITPCPNNGKLSARFTNLTMMDKGPGKIAYESQVLNSKEIKRLYGSTTVKRCGSNSTQCNVVKRVKEHDICSPLLSRFVYKIFMNSFQPKWSCPLKPGNYEQKEITVNTNLLFTVIRPDDNSVWKISFNVLDENKKLFFCTLVTAKIKHHNHKNLKE